MPNKLTAKQEAFCLAVAEGKSLAQAYRENYNTENMTEKSVWELASREMAKVKVTSRVAELHKLAQERTLVTIQSITDELDENRQIAAGLEQPAAMNTATMGKAKVHGLLVDKLDAVVEGNITFETIYEAKPSVKD